MSAFVVPKAHIDALVAAGLRAQAGAYAELPLTWSVPRRREPARLDFLSADAVGRMLWRENVRSVAARYPNEAAEWADAMVDANAYGFPPLARVPALEAAAVLKAISCLEYQSCEHRGWKTSEAKRFCEALRTRLVCGLPGYREAAWAVDGVEPAGVAR